MYQITSKVESAINDGVFQCEFVCDTEADVVNLPTSTKAGKGGKDVYDNIVCEAGSSAYIVDDNAICKLYILNSQDEWVPQEIAAGYSAGGGSGNGGGSVTMVVDFETTVTDGYVTPSILESTKYLELVDHIFNGGLAMIRWIPKVDFEDFKEGNTYILVPSALLTSENGTREAIFNHMYIIDSFHMLSMNITVGASINDTKGYAYCSTTGIVIPRT